MRGRELTRHFKFINEMEKIAMLPIDIRKLVEEGKSRKEILREIHSACLFKIIEVDKLLEEEEKEKNG